MKFPMKNLYLHGFFGSEPNHYKIQHTSPAFSTFKLYQAPRGKSENKIFKMSEQISLVRRLVAAMKQSKGFDRIFDKVGKVGLRLRP